MGSLGEWALRVPGAQPCVLQSGEVEEDQDEHLRESEKE